MTLDDILSRCEQHGECLLWTGPLYDGSIAEFTSTECGATLTDMWPSS